jgi:hypothetical protein
VASVADGTGIGALGGLSAPVFDAVLMKPPAPAHGRA